MTRYIYWCLADIITGLLILIVPNFIKFFRTYKRRNRICLGVLTIMINIIVILSALSFGVFYIWLNHLDEKNYKGSRFSLDYVDHLGGYAVGYTAFVFAITYIIEFFFD